MEPPMTAVLEESAGDGDSPGALGGLAGFDPTACLYNVELRLGALVSGGQSAGWAQAAPCSNVDDGPIHVSEKGVHDDFGLHVRRRNVRKWSAARSLIQLQDKQQEYRWQQTAAQETWAPLASGRWRIKPRDDPRISQPRRTTAATWSRPGIAAQHFAAHGPATQADPSRGHGRRRGREWVEVESRGGQDRFDCGGAPTRPCGWEGTEAWWEELRCMVWDGVPRGRREEVYMISSGAQHMMDNAGPHYYQSLVRLCEVVSGSAPDARGGASGDDPASEAVGGAGTGPGPGDLPERSPGAGSGEHVARGVVVVGQQKRAAGEGGGEGWVQVDYSLDCTELDSDTAHGLLSPLSSTATSTPPSPAVSWGGLDAAGALDRDWARQVFREIDLDVERVFSHGAAKVNGPEGKRALRRLLRAYAVRNRRVGYCQGLNFLAGLFLEVLPEHKAFWLLATVCEDINHDYYTSCMLKARSDIQALKDIVGEELPRLAEHCLDTGMPLELVVTQWVLCQFINCFPATTAIRVLEVVFLEGADGILAVALAFLRLHEPHILQAQDMQELVDTVEWAQSGMYDAGLLFQQAWRELERLRGDIRSLRAWHLGQMVEKQTRDKAKANRPPNSHGGEREDLDSEVGLVGRSRFGGGSAIVYVVPHNLAVHVLSAVAALNKKAYLTTHSLLVDGSLSGTPIAPFMLRNLQWIMGWPDIPTI